MLSIGSRFSTKRDLASSIESVQAVDEIPTDRPIQFGEVFAIRNGVTRYLTHDFHKFAGKFIPQVPRWAIKKYLNEKKHKIILDPFVGSGTTLVEAVLHGHQSYGIDIDPLARLISKVKITKIPANMLRAAVATVEKDVLSGRSGRFRPDIPTLRHWFSKGAIEDLSTIYDCIEKHKSKKDIHDFLTVVFSSIVRRASNADNQTMKTYVSHTHVKKLEHAKPLFVKRLNDYAERLIDFQSAAPSFGKAKVLTHYDARTVGEFWLAKKLTLPDLIIGSPPYIKSVDYIYNQMAELFWIGGRWNLQTQTLQNIQKSFYVGTDRVPAGRNTPISKTGLKAVDEITQKIYLRNSKLGHVTSGYFKDMIEHFASVRSMINIGTRYVLVIGDSTIATVPVPTHKLLSICADLSGFDLEEMFGYEVRNKHMRFPRQGRGGVVSHDWVLTLRAR